MQKNEIWVSNFWDGRNGVLVGDRVEPNVWECIYLIRVGEREFAKDEGGRVSSRIDSSAYYMGEGQILEEEFSKFYHKDTHAKIVPRPEIIPEPEICIDSSKIVSFKYNWSE
jgi:hypothetical protein